MTFNTDKLMFLYLHSNMVELKREIKNSYYNVISVFTFQYGRIKTGNTAIVTGYAPLFTFQYGRIKTGN